MNPPIPAFAVPVRVSGDLIDHAADLLDQLVDLVQATHVGVLELNLSEVDCIDADGLEVLLSVWELLVSRGQALLLSEVSPSITRAVYGAGLHHALHRGEITRSSTVTGRPARVIPLQQRCRPNPPWFRADLSGGLEQSGEQVISHHWPIAGASWDLFT